MKSGESLICGSSAIDFSGPFFSQLTLISQRHQDQKTGQRILHKKRCIYQNSHQVGRTGRTKFPPGH